MTPGQINDSVQLHFLDQAVSADGNTTRWRQRLTERQQEVCEEFCDEDDWPFLATSGTVTVSAGASSVNLPSDFFQMNESGGVYIESQVTPLRRVEPNVLWQEYQQRSGVDGGTGKPACYAIIGESGSTAYRQKIQFDCLTDQAYVVTLYYRMACPLVMDRPLAPTVALAGAGAGNVNTGAHYYLITFIATDGTESESGTASAVVTTTSGSNGKVALSAIPLGSSSVASRKIYRTAAGATIYGTYGLVTTLSDNTTTTYTDNTADSGLGAAPPGVTSALSRIPAEYHRSVIQKGLLAYTARDVGDGRATEFEARYRRELGRAKSRRKSGLEDDERIAEDGYASYRMH